MELWQDIIDHWEAKRVSMFTDKLYKYGVPHRYRAKVWKCEIGNELHVTPELYGIFRTHARAAAQSLLSPNDICANGNAEMGPDDNSDGTTVMENDSRAHSRSSTMSSVPSLSFKKSLENTGSRSLLGNESSVSLIPMDLPRTIAAANLCGKGSPIRLVRSVSPIDSRPVSPLFNENQSTVVGDGRKELDMAFAKMQAVLEAYACYRPDVGYVQGMSYLAAMLIGTGDEMSEFDMFLCLANVLHRPCVRTFYSMDMNKVRSFDDHAVAKFLYRSTPMFRCIKFC